MREGIGNAFIVNLIIIFVIIFIVLFAGSTSYTKAYKVKNRIINIIEENRGLTDSAKDEINTFLGDTGYKLVGSSRCRNHYGANMGELVWNPTNGYRYCVEKFTQGGENQKVYYGVTAYMYFEIPIISSLVEIPVYGETKTIGILEN